MSPEGTGAGRLHRTVLHGVGSIGESRNGCEVHKTVVVEKGGRMPFSDGLRGQEIKQQ